VSTKLALFRLGFVFYVLSFFLVATDDHKGIHLGRLRGYQCAYSVVPAALTTTPFSPGSTDYVPPSIYLSILISALITPVFLVNATLIFLKRAPRTASLLKFLLLAMIPFCWVVFHALAVYPREGHFFWVIGMLLVLFS
jgi:hypothetical protein